MTPFTSFRVTGEAEACNVTIPITQIPIPFCIGVAIGIEIGFGISITLRKRYLEKLSIFHKA